MSKLILPNSEPTNAQLILPSRRGFIKGTAMTLASLFVAPSIIKAENLMHIDSQMNRLVYAFSMHNAYHGTAFNINKCYPSLLNLAAMMDPVTRALWEDHHRGNSYEFVRRADIPAGRELCYGGGHQPMTADEIKTETNFVEGILDRYRRSAAVLEVYNGQHRLQSVMKPT